MRKSVLLSVIASTMIMAGGDVKPVEPVVAEPVPVVEEESFGTVSGQLRSFYVDRTYSGILENNRNSWAFGGWIGYDTADWHGLTAGVKFYAVENASLHDGPKTSASYDPSLFGGEFDNYGFIGEAYLNWKGENTNIKVGRQKLNTPLAGADDARMLPNLFEAAVLSNTSLEDTTLVLAQVTRETVGTFGNVYGTPSALSLQGGYGLGYKKGTSGNFANMGEIAIGEAGKDTSGVTMAAVVYKGVEGLSLQAWNYYAYDLMNALYLSADYGFGDAVKMKVSAQYIGQSDVGDSLAGEVDSNYWGAKFTAAAGSLSGYVAYSATSDSDGSTMNGGIITPWGGIPAYTQGMVTRHMFFADTDTWKVAGTWKLNEMTGLNLKASAYYVSFDVGAANTYKPGESWTADEAGFDIQYQATKALNLRMRANFPSDFAPGLDWSEYRLIANYNF